MKKYILLDDLQCRYLAKDKKDLIDFTKWYLKEWNVLSDLWLYKIKYNSKKIDIDNFFWDIIAIDKKENESIDYDNYLKYWIKDWLCKKDFLYYSI